MENQKRYWFPAKRYGWGWGLPTMWQGWVVTLCYVISLILIFFLLPPAAHGRLFGLAVIVATAVLVAICWIKGEPPKWRWGGK